MEADMNWAYDYEILASRVKSRLTPPPDKQNPKAGSGDPRSPRQIRQLERAVYKSRPIVTSESVEFCQSLSMMLTDGNRYDVVFSEHRLLLPLRACPH